MSSLPLLQLLRRRYRQHDSEYLLSRVLCGEVYVDGERIRDPKSQVNHDSEVQILGDRFVSRGGVKLEYVIKSLDIPIRDRVFLDCGSSTGGFTDCLLQNGARFVHAVDVGTNQLAYKLRIDKRVGVYERTNILSVDILNPPPEFAVVDLSFRSLRRAAAYILDLVDTHAALMLVKPQFEWTNPDENFRGVVENSDTLVSILAQLAVDLKSENVGVAKIVPSPILGRKGNREFFFHLVKGSICSNPIDREQVRKIIK